MRISSDVPFLLPILTPMMSLVCGVTLKILPTMGLLKNGANITANS